MLAQDTFIIIICSIFDLEIRYTTIGCCRKKRSKSVVGSGEKSSDDLHHDKRIMLWAVDHKYCCRLLLCLFFVTCTFNQSPPFTNHSSSSCLLLLTSISSINCPDVLVCGEMDLFIHSHRILFCHEITSKTRLLTSGGGTTWMTRLALRQLTPNQSNDCFVEVFGTSITTSLKSAISKVNNVSFPIVTSRKRS